MTRHDLDNDIVEIHWLWLILIWEQFLPLKILEKFHHCIQKAQKGKTNKHT